MKYEFYIDPQTGQPHFANHGLSEDDVIDVLEDSELVLRGRDDSLIAMGKTRNGLSAAGNLRKAKSGDSADHHRIYSRSKSHSRGTTPDSQETISNSDTSDPNNYPPGWDRERVEAIIRYYEGQSDEEAAAEIEAAEEAGEWLLVPVELVPEVEALIEAYEGRKAS